MTALPPVEIDYIEDPSVPFSQLLDQAWPILLDSGRPGTTSGRYDIFSASPHTTLVTQGNQTEITTKAGCHTSFNNPFQLVKEALGPRIEPIKNLPFCGGAMGYFSYDLGRQLEQLPVISESDVNMPEMAVGLYDWAVVTDHEQRSSWIVSLGRDVEASEQLHGLVNFFTVNGKNPINPQAYRLESELLSNFTKTSYEKAFTRIKHYIREGDCYQVNLAQRYSAKVSGDPWEAYRRLRILNPAPFAAFMQIPPGAVMSSSPERFLKVTNGTVETKPIKGTRPRSTNKVQDQALAEELRNSIKDQAENLMIVDLLRNDLGKTCATGSIKVPKLFALESFATVHHLVSTITGRLGDQRHALDLLADCFPGGSITGAPKVRAMEIIEELEPHRRSIYCGAIGYIGADGSMDTNIVIRTLVHSEDVVHAWVGGGIVFDSNVEQEYQETLDKGKAMLKMLKGEENVGR